MSEEDYTEEPLIEKEKKQSKTSVVIKTVANSIETTANIFSDTITLGSGALGATFVRFGKCWETYGCSGCDALSAKLEKKPPSKINEILKFSVKTTKTLSKTACDGN